MEKLKNIVLPTDDELENMPMNDLKLFADKMLPYYLARTEGNYCFVEQNELWKKERFWFKCHMIIKKRGGYGSYE